MKDNLESLQNEVKSLKEQSVQLQMLKKEAD